MEEREPLQPGSPQRTARTSGTEATPREDQACFSTRRMKKLVYSQAGQGMDRLVDARQLQEWPSGTLACARCTKVALWGLVLASTITMIGEYFVGELGVETEIIKIGAFPVPNIVICPMWGQKGMHVKMAEATVGNYMVDSPEHYKTVNFTSGSCHNFDFEYVRLHHETVSAAPMHNEQIEALGCYCTAFGDEELELTEEKVGREAVRIAFSTNFENDAGAPLVSIGFSHGNVYPTDWAYLETGKRTVAELYMESRAYAKTVVTAGTTLDKFNLVTKAAFPIPGVAHPSSTTELVMYPGSFFVREISDVASIWSLFSLVSLLVIVMANMNSIQLFDICFPEKVDAQDPSQLEPSWILQRSCGCFLCCKRPAHSDDGDGL